MALYGHFADKNALYDAMRGAFITEALQGVNGTTWQEQLAQISRGYLLIVRAHPHLVPLLARQSPPPDSVFPVMDRLFQSMMADGFQFVHGLQSWLAAQSFGIGIAITERTRTGNEEISGSPASDRWLMMMNLLPRLPKVRESSSIADIAGQLESFGWDDLFNLGVRNYINGLETRLAAAKAAQTKLAQAKKGRKPE